MSDDESPSPKPGSYSDLARRMDRMEQNHERLSRDVSNLTGTVARVELNQTHAEKLSEVRFGALDQSVALIGSKLDNFMSRVEGIITGEISTAQMKQGEAIMVDYQQWRSRVEDRLDSHDKFEIQARFLARLGVLILTTNVVSLLVAVVAFLKS